ncbi:hypothetical protein L0Y65_04965 [Candidatus Micrarchaeota archaeon]|nr:hypothetical protein [Candidatus Micrarchaeota archaeon]
MCRYSDFSMLLGSGDALILQLLTVATIAAGIAFWVRMYRRQGVALAPYSVPIVLWIVFGTLDIIATAKGTLNAPGTESNPLARYVFVQAGFLGPIVASVLWISLWSLLVLIINKRLWPDSAKYLSLAVFYSLAIGHVFGFSSWFDATCALARWEDGFLAFIPEFLRITGFGAIAAAVHFFLQGQYIKSKKER